MGGSGVIDNFLGVFTRYIDSGFGLLSGEVGFIATTLIVIDVTIAALFWSWGADDDIIARLVKKTLFVGVFAYLISNWNSLAKIVFDSFAGLGLKASGTGFTAQDLMRPGKVAQTGLDAARPLLEAISPLMGWLAVFENLIQIVCLLFAWALVILAFFILAIQLFVTLIEFKLSTLAGFVLIPFGLFGKTAFMAERVLGNVISSGIKVLVLAVIIGIGSTLFSQFTQGFGGNTPTIDDAMAIVLAALSLLGLGIFGPGIANGFVSGGPQLGAGAAVGTGLAERLFDSLELEGYRAQSVVYAMAWTAEHSGRRIDLQKIWREQKVSDEISSVLLTVCGEAHKFLSSRSGNIGEASKKPETWAIFRSLEFELQKDWQDGLRTTPVESYPAGRQSPEAATSLSAVINIPASDWFNLAKWSKEHGFLEGWERSLAFSLGRLAARGAQPSAKQAVQGARIAERARELGFLFGDVKSG
jgi:type IV secretion system protein TrbL